MPFPYRPDRNPTSWLLLVLLCAAALYANTAFYSFVHDDNYQILNNPYLRDTSHIRQIFTTPVWSFAGAHHSNYFRPVMMLGYLACYQLFGPSPFFFHLVNLLLHVSVVWLLFSVTLRIFGSPGIAFTAASIFAFHPIHSEAVAWIAAVTELELAFFYLLAFRFFLDLESPGKRFPRHALLMSGSFILALLSKEQAMTLPVVATIYEGFYRADRFQTSWKQKLLRIAPLWTIALLYLPVRTRFLGGLAPEIKFAGMTLYQLVLSACALLGQYLGKLIYPAHLSAFYFFQKSTSVFDPPVILGLFACAVSLALFAVLWKHARTASFGVFWIFVTLAPVLNPQWLGTNAFTERYAYLPSVGLSWIAAVGIHRLLLFRPRPRLLRVACAAGLAVIAFLCVVRIVTRNRDWKDNLTFYSRRLDGAPAHTAAARELRLNLGVQYLETGDMPAAEQQFRTILADDPGNRNALNDLAGLLLHTDRPVSATELYLRLVNLDPANAQAHMNLGVAYMRLDMLEQAEPELLSAVNLAPASASAQDNLGSLYLQKGDPARAERCFRRALALDPTNTEAHIALARFYAAAARDDEAAREYQAVLRADPGNLTALRALRSVPAGR